MRCLGVSFTFSQYPMQIRKALNESFSLTLGNARFMRNTISFLYHVLVAEKLGLACITETSLDELGSVFLVNQKLGPSSLLNRENKEVGRVAITFCDTFPFYEFLVQTVLQVLGTNSSTTVPRTVWGFLHTSV